MTEFLRRHWLYSIGHLAFGLLFFVGAVQCGALGGPDWAVALCAVPAGFFAAFPWWFYMSGEW